MEHEMTDQDLLEFINSIEIQITIPPKLTAQIFLIGVAANFTAYMAVGALSVYGKRKAAKLREEEELKKAAKR